MPRDDDDFDPGFERRPRRKSASGPSTAKVLLIVFGLLAILGCLGCGGFFGWAWFLYFPTWTTHTSADGSYTINFPSKTVTAGAGTGPDARAYTSSEAKFGFPVSKYFVRQSTVAANEAKKAEDLLNKVADSWKASLAKATEADRAIGDYNGHPSLDLVMKKGERTTCLRIILVGTKLYTLSVESDVYSEDDDPVMEFFDSFHPIDNAPVKKK